MYQRFLKLASEKPLRQVIGSFDKKVNCNRTTKVNAVKLDKNVFSLAFLNMI